jgi:hypothetical protein
MRYVRVFATAVVMAGTTIGGTAFAQKGTGEPTGMGQRADKPAIVSMSGIVKDNKIGPCKQTTGRSSEGAHLIIQSQEKSINLHLGPSSDVGDVLKAATVGQQITFDGFRTDRMPPDAYVAKTVKTAGQTFTLRDDDLRPRWAGRGGGGGQGMGQGMGAGADGRYDGCF